MENIGLGISSFLGIFCAQPIPADDNCCKDPNVGILLTRHKIRVGANQA